MGSLTEGSNLLFIPDRAGYQPITNPDFSTVYGQVKLSGEVTADGRMTLILYYEAWWDIPPTPLSTGTGMRLPASRSSSPKTWLLPLP